MERISFSLQISDAPLVVVLGLTSRKFIVDVLAIAKTEFQRLLRNRTALLISLILLPGFFIFALGAGQGPSGRTLPPSSALPVAYIDLDHTAASSAFWEHLHGSGDFYNLVDGYNLDSALRTLGTRRIFAAIVVPQGFQTKLDMKKPAEVILYVDDTQPAMGDTILSNLRKHSLTFRRAVGLEVRTGAGQSLIQVIPRGATYAGIDVGLGNVLAIVTVFATFFEIAGGFARDREEGSFPRVILAPVNLWAILLGKTAFDAVINVARSLIVIAIAINIYGARPHTDLGTMIVLALLIAMLTMGAAFFTSALKPSARTVVIVEFLFILVLFAFGGLFVDKELLSGPTRIFRELLPWSYGFDAFKRTILIGRPLLSLTEDLISIGTAIVIFYIAAYLLLWRSRERLIE